MNILIQHIIVQDKDGQNNTIGQGIIGEPFYMRNVYLYLRRILALLVKILIFIVKPVEK